MKGTSDSTFTPRNRLAAVSIPAGNLTSWNPNASNDVNVLMFGPPTFTGAGVSTVYAAGSFNNVGGITRSKIAEINLADGTLTGWNPNANGGATINALATNERYVYVGGSGLTQVGARRATTSPRSIASPGRQPAGTPTRMARSCHWACGECR